MPVATISDMSQIDPLLKKLQAQGISCIEVTLRTDVALDAIQELKRLNIPDFKVGVGTLVDVTQLNVVDRLGVDFIVSPGLERKLATAVLLSGIPYLPGVVTPSEVMKGLNLGLNTFKLFPASIVGGLALLKNYAALFPEIKFCPTGGINEENHQEYLALPNVISVGGSWVV